MTKRKVIEMLTAKAECIRRESSGIDVDCNFRNCDECDLCYKQGTMEDQMEALGVAISALQAQDLQPICNNLATDCISRQAAIDALMDEFKRIPTMAIRAKNVIEQLPPAQPEIVMCKDCKLFGDPKCLMCFDGYDWAEPDGYCHMAERREE